MNRFLLLAAILAAIAVVAVWVAIDGGGRPAAADDERVVSALGVAQVQGQEVFVHIIAVVPPGEDDDEVADVALKLQGARRANANDLQSAAFTTTGLVWDQFGDANPSNDFATQYYNPGSASTEDDPTGGGGEPALLNTHSTWTNVATSSFAFQYGGQTDRCPSLVRECQEPQFFDGNNDVAWLELRGCCTLGVIWYSTSIDEADVALNVDFDWSTGCTDQPGAFDAQTVLLHENGHFGGLGHSNVVQAVMFASYGGARCALHQDDIDGISSLYPSGSPPPTPTTTPTDTPAGPTATPTSTATPTNSPTPTNTPTATLTPEPGTATVTVETVSASAIAPGEPYDIEAEISNDGSSTVTVTVRAVVEQIGGTATQTLADQQVTIVSGDEGAVIFEDTSTVPLGEYTVTITVLEDPEVGTNNTATFLVEAD